MEPRQLWRFAGCEFDEWRRELRVDGVAVDVEVKPLDVLHQLLLHTGDVVTKDELLDAVWPGVEVVEGSLATAVSKLRKAMGRHQHAVATVPRVGYRLAVPSHHTLLPSAPPMEKLTLEPGSAVAGREQWKLVRQLGTSPSNQVWLVENAKTREERVFKFAAAEPGLRLLRREVTLARLLRESLGERPGFVKILEWNFVTPPYFIESEKAGRNLADWCEAQGGVAAVPLETRLRLFVQAASAVADAHSLDILHKDLKPSNLLVSDVEGQEPQIRVGDFGSASLLDPTRLEALRITKLGFTSDDPGAVSGTMMYLAPELLSGHSPSRGSDVYALGLLLYQLIAADFRKPLAPGWEADVAHPLLREDIASAAAGDPAKRMSSARELAGRVDSLDSRNEFEPAVPQAASSSRPAMLWLAVVAIAVLAIALTMAWRKPQAPPAELRTVAVLPFRQAGSDASLEYLSQGLADEVTANLLRSPGLAVRRASDAKQVKADAIVTGRYRRAGDDLHITLDATEAAGGRLLAQESFNVPSSSLIALQVQIALRLKSGSIARALGGREALTGPEPKSEEAYRLFLRAAAFANDGGANAEAIGMLEKSVALDSGYSPTWFALSKRYYMESRYQNGDAALLEKSRHAMEKVLALDPTNTVAASNRIVGRVESGELVEAVRAAQDILRRRPDSADAHFALSYALRFAGLLTESAKHCESAFALDPRNYTSGLRSCAVAYLLLDDYPRTINFLRLDHGSDFERALLIHLYLRKGERGEALRLGAGGIPQWGTFEMLRACAAGRPAKDVASLASGVQASSDPETNYFLASHLAYCGQAERALALLQKSIAGNYCAYPAVNRDPFWKALKDSADFRLLADQGKACQDRFVAQRAAPANGV